jgi:hypothetical protein
MRFISLKASRRAASNCPTAPSTSAWRRDLTNSDPQPLVLHLVYRFDTGGLENGVVNLINHMPAAAYRHAMVALTEVALGFAQRIGRDDVKLVSLHKRPCHGAKLYPRLVWLVLLVRLFRESRLVIVRKRNLAVLGCQVPTFQAS